MSQKRINKSQIEGKPRFESLEEELEYLHASTTVYEHEQEEPATQWVVEHNLGRFPQVTLIDEYGNVVYSFIGHESKNKLAVKFSEPVSGSAILR